MSEIRVNSIIAEGGSSAPNLAYGAQVPTGMGITGAGGINVTGVVTATSYSGSGANLTGVANTDYVDAASITSSGIVSVTNTTASTSTSTGALIVSGGVGIAGSMFVGENVSIGGTLTYEDVTNIDSVGVVTARLGVLATAGRGVDITAGGLKVAAGIATFGGGDIQIAGSATGITSVTWDASADALIFKDKSYAKFGDGSDLNIYHDGSNSYLQNKTGNLYLTAKADEDGIIIRSDGASELYFNNTKRIESTNTGAVVTGILTATTAAVIGTGITANNGNIHFNKTLIEKTSIAGGTLGSNNNHSLADGMVYYCTGNESGNLTYNIRQDGSTALSAVMGVGETITTTVILTPNNSGKINTLQIDGQAQTVEESGGDAFSAGSDGYDVYTFTILRTGTGTTDYLVLGTKSNHT